jgi:hypothetical protein
VREDVWRKIDKDKYGEEMEKVRKDKQMKGR